MSHAVAVAGYLAAMIVNPNNHALDASQATSPMELEVMEMLAEMFGFPERSIGHLTSSGTIANLEALWVARELRPGSTVVYSEGAHYTHGRMCQVLGVESRAVPAHPDGRIDLDAVEAACREGAVGTVVLTPGTTGLGAVDDVHEALELRERYGVRLHVDAAYGGFFALLGGDAYGAIGSCDSVVVDPHAHVVADIAAAVRIDDRERRDGRAGEALGLEGEVDVALLLDVAREAAHAVARPAAPVRTIHEGGHGLDHQGSLGQTCPRFLAGCPP